MAAEGRSGGGRSVAAVRPTLPRSSPRTCVQADVARAPVPGAAGLRCGETRRPGWARPPRRARRARRLEDGRGAVRVVALLARALRRGERSGLAVVARGAKQRRRHRPRRARKPAGAEQAGRRADSASDGLKASGGAWGRRAGASLAVRACRDAGWGGYGPQETSDTCKDHKTTQKNPPAGHSRQPVASTVPKAGA